MSSPAPNRLATVLKYFSEAVAFARGEAAVKSSRRVLFRTELAEMARTSYAQAEPVDAARLWALAVSSPWLGPNMQLIANRLTAQPLTMKRRHGERMEDVPNHAVERLLAQPNPLWPGVMVWQYGVMWYLLRGNGYWFISTPTPGAGMPVEIWPLDSSAMLVKPETLHEGRGVFRGRLVIDYIVTIQGREFPLPGENVIQWRTPNPFDYWQGLSPLNAGALGLGVDYEQAKWLHGFYGVDNAVPTAVISLPPDIDDATFDAAKMEIREQFGEKRRSAITRAGDLNVQVIEQALADMEMVASREFNGKLLDRVYGIPEGLISGGLSGDSRLAAETAFARNTIQPLLTSWASALDARLTPYWQDDNLILTAPDVTPQDRALDLQEFNTHSPFLSVNEARELLGKPTFAHEMADVPLKLLDLVGGQRSEVGGQGSEVGGQRSEVGGQGSEVRGRGDGGQGSEVGETEEMGALPGADTPENEVARLANGKSEDRGQRSEVRGQRSEVGGQGSEDEAEREGIRAELRRWRKVAVKTPGREFVSAIVPADVRASIESGLVKAQTEDERRAVFGTWLSGKANPYHEPAGTPAGGQFAQAPIGNQVMTYRGYTVSVRPKPLSEQSQWVVRQEGELIFVADSVAEAVSEIDAIELENEGADSRRIAAATEKLARFEKEEEAIRRIWQGKKSEDEMQEMILLHRRRLEEIANGRNPQKAADETETMKTVAGELAAAAAVMAAALEGDPAPDSDIGADGGTAGDTAGEESADGIS